MRITTFLTMKNTNIIPEDDQNEACTIINVIKWSFIIFIAIASFYFIIIGMGYGMSIAIFQSTHNMTNGVCFNKDPTICTNKMCYFNNNQLSGFFGGCVPVGLLCFVVLLFIPPLIFFGIGLILMISSMFVMLCIKIYSIILEESIHIYDYGVNIINKLVYRHSYEPLNKTDSVPINDCEISLK